MELRPGYRQTDVGEIPKDWSVGLIKDFASIKTGKRNTEDRIDDGAYPFFVRSQVVERINGYSFDGEAVLTAGDGVGTGKVFHYIQGRFDFHQRVYRISDFSPALNGFFFFLYFSNHFYDRIMSMTAKSSVDSVRMEMIADMPIPLPSPLEQRAIAGALADIDKLIGVLTQLIAKKRDLKQAAMQQLLTGQTRLPGFNGEWATKRLGELFFFSGGLSASREQLSEAGLCYLHYGDIHKATKSFIDVEGEFIDIPKLEVPLSAVSASALLQDGDVVFVDASEDEEGTSRHVVVVNPRQIPYIGGLHTIIAKDRADALDSGYKRYCFQSQNVKEQFRFYAAGTKVSGISKTSIAKIFLTIPPSAPEQAAIATVLCDMDAELVALEQRLAKTRALKQGMMQELLTGRTRLV